MSEVKNNAGPYSTVADVAAAGLCCFCGACQEVCPNKAVALRWGGAFPVPVVDSDICTNCGLCVAVCPGHNVEFDKLNTELFGQIPDDKILGHHQSIYVGGINDSEARFRRTSGGIAKELAIEGLKSGQWDGVLLSRLCQDNPLRTETYLAVTAEEVNSAASSLYCPVPACAGWQSARDFPGKLCFVGLPCHIQALRKGQRLDWLRKKIFFSIGLFCSGTPGFYATEAFLLYHGIDPQQVSAFEYRSEGWPGEICVEVKGESEAHKFARGSAAKLLDELRFGAAFHRRGVFTHRRCLLCPDHTAELSDVSLGDAWRIDYHEEKGKPGLNIVIVRSGQAQQLLERMLDDKIIFLDNISRQEVIKSQRECLFSKKNLNGLFSLLERRHLARPDFSGQPVIKTGKLDRLTAWVEWNQLKLAKNKRLWRLLPLLTPVMVLLRRLATRNADKKLESVLDNR